MTALVVPSASTAETTIPTSVPVAASSDTVFASSLASIGLVTSNSSASRIPTVNVDSAVDPSVLVARIAIVHVVELS